MMNPEHTIYVAQYFTATIYKWQVVLADDSNIIIHLRNFTMMEQIALGC